MPKWKKSIHQKTCPSSPAVPIRDEPADIWVRLPVADNRYVEGPFKETFPAGV